MLDLFLCKPGVQSTSLAPFPSNTDTIECDRNCVRDREVTRTLMDTETHLGVSYLMIVKNIRST